MRRVGLAVVLTVSLVLASVTVGAQQAGKVPRLGVLVPAEPVSPTEPNVGAFRLGRRDLRYVEGRNITVEYRYAHGKTELYPELVAQLVGLNVDVMVVGSGPAALAAKAEVRRVVAVSLPAVTLLLVQASASYATGDGGHGHHGGSHGFSGPLGFPRPFIFRGHPGFPGPRVFPGPPRFHGHFRGHGVIVIGPTFWWDPWWYYPPPYYYPPPQVHRRAGAGHCGGATAAVVLVLLS